MNDQEENRDSTKLLAAMIGCIGLVAAAVITAIVGPIVVNKFLTTPTPMPITQATLTQAPHHRPH